MDGDNSNVLLLNSTFEPLTIINIHRAFQTFIYKNTFRETRPILFISKGKNRIPSVHSDSLLRKGLIHSQIFQKNRFFIRDNYQCQYCGKPTVKPTLDNVIPKQKNGNNDWFNVVTAYELQ